MLGGLIEYAVVWFAALGASVIGYKLFDITGAAIALFVTLMAWSIYDGGKRR